jgi:hypothetical protein
MLLHHSALGVAETAKDVFLQDVFVEVVEGNKADFHRDLQFSYASGGAG